MLSIVPRIVLAISLMLSASLASADEPLRIHLISGSGEYKSAASLKMLIEELESNYQIECTASWASDGAKQLDNLAPLANADLMIVFARRMKLAEEQMKQIRNHWQQGKPVIGIRTAGHAFGNDDNEVFDRQVLGGHYSGHYGGEAVDVITRAEAKGHPILKGVGEFTSAKLYKAGELADDTIVLQTGKIAQAEHPVTIVHECNGGRMFFTALGVPSDFENKEFRTMLLNAVFWVTERDLKKLRK